jgi:TolB-like protein/tetratricopeptide (TPR) repeat protein
MQKFLTAARARNLDRFAVAYAVAGWLLVQGASIVLPAFAAPGWAMQVFIVAVLGGFPAAAIVAWFVTPPSLDAGETVESASHREIILLALLGVVLVLSVGELVFLAGRKPSVPAMTPVAAQPASIAVLPFVNMSGDPAREVVSDGISEELLNDLANVTALRVAARTSSFAFKGRNEDVKSIATKLNVHNILEGSIREDGQHIRITAQLIDATNGFHLWSETYDREMTGILTLEDEIARSITSALTRQLLGVPKAALAGKPAVIDPDVYREYLEGLHEFAPRTVEGVSRAVRLLRDATRRQPDFADGFAALGRALIDEAENHPQDGQLMGEAEMALARALTLDPANVNALAAHLDMALHRLDWTAAGDDARRLRAINPNSDAVLHEMFRYYQALGFPELALQAVQQTVQLDPLSVVDRLNETAAFIHIARFPEAAASAQAALELAPGQTYIQAMLCTAWAHSGRLADARRIQTAFASAQDAGDAQACGFDIAVSEGRNTDAVKINDGFAAHYRKGDMSASHIGEKYAVAGAPVPAMTWFEKANDNAELSLCTIAYDRSIPPSFFATQAWKALAQKPLLQRWRAAHDALAAELAHGG